MNKSIKKHLFFLIIIYAIIFISSLFIGRYAISIKSFFYLNNQDLQLEKNIILNLRLPRAIVATLAGISLSLSGLIYQETFQNDLVSPDLLGVSSGAGVGASIAIVFGLSNFFIAIFSFTFGIFTVILTVLISNVFRSKNNITLILSGIIVGGFMSSILTTIKYFVNPETQLSTIVYWLMGSFANVTYNNIAFMLPVVLILFVILMCISHRINLIALGKEETETKGVNYILYRNIIIAIATMLTATTVSCCGTIGWIGLIIPHIVKSMVGRDVNKTLPLCAVTGATFTLITDIIARSITQSEIPISAITGILGAVILTIILINQNNERINVSTIKKEDTKLVFNEALDKNIDKHFVVAKINKIIDNSNNSIMRIENIYFRYNKKMDYILKNISLDIYENKILLLYGANGSGKTTLLKIISGILKPIYGKVLIKYDNSEFDINKMSLINRSKIISYVKQNFSNINNILVKDYLILGMVNELKFYEKPTQEQIQRVEKYATELNITKLLDKKFFEISGGEKQLVVLCQSLLQNANILILDEPTSALDSDNQELVINILLRLVKEYNKTIVFSTHNKSHKNINGCIVKTLKDGCLFN